MFLILIEIFQYISIQILNINFQVVEKKKKKEIDSILKDHTKLFNFTY